MQPESQDPGNRTNGWRGGAPQGAKGRELSHNYMRLISWTAWTGLVGLGSFLLKLIATTLQQSDLETPPARWQIESHLVGHAKVITIDNFLEPELVDSIHRDLHHSWNHTTDWLYTTNVPGTNTKVRSRENVKDRRALVQDAVSRDPLVFAYSKWELLPSSRVYKLLRSAMQSAEKPIARLLQVLRISLSARVIIPYITLLPGATRRDIGLIRQLL